MAVHATVRELLEEVYRKAGELQLWSIVRFVRRGISLAFTVYGYLLAYVSDTIGPE